MNSIDTIFDDSQATHGSPLPKFSVVPKARPYFTRVRDVRCGSPVDQAVFACLGTYANPETDACWPSLSTLCADTRYSLRSVLRALTRLERDGHISRDRSKGGRGTAGQAVTTRYRLRLPPTPAGCHPQQGQGAGPSTGRVPDLALAGCRTKSQIEETTEAQSEAPSLRAHARARPTAPAPAPPSPPTTATAKPSRELALAEIESWNQWLETVTDQQPSQQPSSPKRSCVESAKG